MHSKPPIPPGNYDADLVEATLNETQDALDVEIAVHTPEGDVKVAFTLRPGESTDDWDAWDGYPASAWDKDSLAVVASDGKEGCVLWTAGPHVRMEIEEFNMCSLSDLGLDDAPQGISIWVGRYVWFNDSHPLDPDEGSSSEPRGAFRAPTEDDWTAIREGRCPWNDDDWRVE